MSSLFSRVFALLKNREHNPYEDYLTEIFSGVFASEQVLTSFVQTFIDPTIQNPRAVSITTQKTYSKLKGHQSDSRPDLVIQFQNGKQNYIVFWESKLESEEGEAQLRRYADHLAVHQQAGYKTFLFYVTQYHDPKELQLPATSKNNVDFQQFRWFEIYNWLKQNENVYVQHVLHYMEEIGMNESRRFVPQDMYAILNLQRLHSMVEECVGGPVDDQMSRLFGRSLGWTNRFVQVRSMNRYVKYNEQGNGIGIGVGFYFFTEDFPLVSIFLEVNPNSPDRAKMIKCMKKFVKDNPDWETYNLDESAAWPQISCDISLLNFLGEDDHLKSIQEFFVGKLKELHTIKVSTPELNWRSA